MLWELLVIVFIIWMVQRRWLMRRQVDLAKQLKSKMKAFPILGHTYKFFGSDEDRMRAWEAFGREAIEAGGMSKIWHFGRLMICVADPAVADKILNQCLDKHELMKILDLVIGNASIVAPVPIWRHRRRLDAPTFKMKNLIQFVEIFSKHSIAMADLLEKEANKGTFSFKDYIIAGSVNAVCETTMGVKLKLQGSEVLNAIEELWRTAAYIIMSQPWFRNKYVFRFTTIYYKVLKHKRTAYDFVTQVTENDPTNCKIIKEKQRTINESNQAGNERDKNKMSSFLDFQLRESDSTKKLSEQELMEETLLIVVAGYDTVASAMSFIILILSRLNDVQEKVYKELQEVFGDSDRAVTYEDLLQLKYLDAVIKETLRLYPIVPVIAREIDSDVELPSGITIVEGCGALVNIWAIHRNPVYWGEDADHFRPERFLDCPPTHPAAFMPFSYGVRSCIGYRYAMLMLRTMSSTLLRRYRVLAPAGVPQGEPLRTKYEVILRHVDNYEIQLERRK